jgi:hypothetical protein
MSSTVPVTFTVTELRRLHRAGNLLALATVEVDLDGVALTLHGVQVLRLPTGRLQCRAPHYRAQTGAWVPAVTLPDELEVAIGRDPRRVHCMRLTRTSGHTHARNACVPLGRFFPCGAVPRRYRVPSLRGTAELAHDHDQWPSLD